MLSRVRTRFFDQVGQETMYRISANSFRGNYSFLNLTLCTVTFDHSTYRCGNYSREETIQGRKLYEEIRCVKSIATYAPTFFGHIISVLANVN